MIFATITVVFVLIASATIVREHHRARAFTLLSVLSIGNVLYNALTPVVSHYFPDSAVVFERYVRDSGMVISESGLLRVLLAATIFQLVCLCVSLTGSQKSSTLRVDTISNKALLEAAGRVGWVMLLIGVLGVIWLGLIYNGHLLGLYEVQYFERSPLAREYYVQAFMLLVGIYGAAQLIVVFLLSDRTTAAVLILLALTFHGLGMKSKFPVFWVLIVFVMLAVEQGKRRLPLFLPITFSVLVIGVMSFLRGVNLLELPQYIETYWNVVDAGAIMPWENDLPGPATVSYYVINSNVEYTVEPVLEVFRILIPRFIFERGPELSALYAEKILGAQFEIGLGFGWSAICDGFLLAGWIGVGAVAFLFARSARYMDDFRTKAKGKLREFAAIVCYSSAPALFLYGVRESTAGLIKQVLIIAVLVWLPTYYLYRLRESRALRLQRRLADRRVT